MMGVFRKRSVPATTPEDLERLGQQRSVVEAILRRYPPGMSLSFGAPTRCPDCGQYGFIVSVNRIVGECKNRCLSCEVQWTITERALDDIAARPNWAPPVPEPQSPLLVARVASPLAAAPPMRLLVVEDNPFDFATLETIVEPLEGAGIELVHAETFAEGYRQAAADPFDAFMLNLRLPGRPDPISTIVEWRRRVGTGSPLIVTGDDVGATLPSQVKALGVARVLHKQHLHDLAEDPQTGCGRFVQLLTQTIRTHHRIAPSAPPALA